METELIDTISTLLRDRFSDLDEDLIRAILASQSEYLDDRETALSRFEEFVEDYIGRQEV